ncbi:MAG: hypothetical protein JXE07_07255, partial [Candidatus Aminicenantes bacterium]|nr:hypothetical protein [Candidatus Aminicenantes bacterium]
MPKKSFRMGMPFMLAGILLAGLCGCAKKENPADIVLTNGKIVTMDEGLPIAEALAAAGDR